MGGIGFSPIYFEHDVIQRSKYVLKKTMLRLLISQVFYSPETCVISNKCQAFKAQKML